MLKLRRKSEPVVCYELVYPRTLIMICEDKYSDITLSSTIVQYAWELPYLPNIGDNYIAPVASDHGSILGVVEKISHQKLSVTEPTRTFIWCRQFSD